MPGELISEPYRPRQRQRRRRLREQIFNIANNLKLDLNDKNTYK